MVHTWGRDHWYTNIFELGGAAAAPAPQQQGHTSSSRSSTGNSSSGYYFTRGGTQGGEGVIGGAKNTVFSQLSLCVSRACLGKCSVFSIV